MCKLFFESIHVTSLLINDLMVIEKKSFTGFLTSDVPSSPFFQTDYDFKGGDCLKQRVCIAECHLVPFLQSCNVLTVSLLHCLPHEKI